MRRSIIPKSHYIYEFSYPAGMLGWNSIVFYVGKGTSANRMDDHLREAANGCTCRKCQAITSIWEAGLVVVRRIVFETTDEQAALREEKARIISHRSRYLTNIVHGQAMGQFPEWSTYASRGGLLDGYWMSSDHAVQIYAFPD